VTPAFDQTTRLLHHLNMNVIVTGASGVLGTAVHTAFQAAGNKVLGLSHSRSGPGLVQLDLTDPEEVDKLIERARPECLLSLLAFLFKLLLAG